MSELIRAMGAGTVAEWLTLVAAAAIAIAANVLQRHALKHQLRETARLGLLDLTTGEVAQARDRIGTLFYGKRGFAAVSPADVIRSYYTLIWALERANVTASSLSKHRSERSAVAQAWAWHLKEIAWNVWLLGLLSERSTLNLDDVDARARVGAVLARFPVQLDTLGDDDPTTQRWKALALEQHWVRPRDEDRAAAWKTGLIADVREKKLITEDELRLAKRLRACVRFHRLHRAGSLRSS